MLLCRMSVFAADMKNSQAPEARCLNSLESMTRDKSERHRPSEGGHIVCFIDFQREHRKPDAPPLQGLPITPKLP
jgi:hypothetical protein